VRVHVRVDFAEVGLVDEFDDEHGGNSFVTMSIVCPAVLGEAG
jgi:hypothetical protein